MNLKSASKLDYITQKPDSSAVVLAIVVKAHKQRAEDMHLWQNTPLTYMRLCIPPQHCKKKSKCKKGKHCKNNTMAVSLPVRLAFSTDGL